MVADADAADDDFLHHPWLLRILGQFEKDWFEHPPRMPRRRSAAAVVGC